MAPRIILKSSPVLFSQQDKLFLLDGFSLIYRAYFALSKTPMRTAQGIPTGAILGFINTLVEMLQKERPTHIVVAFDSKEKTFRHAAFSAYKAHRQTQPEALSIAIPYIKAILDAFGITCISYAGYEADDLLGTLAQQAAQSACTTYLMSTDKDLAQMVQPYIYLYKPGKNGQKAVVLGEKEVIAQWGIQRPTQVCDMLALAGDPSDGIPGIPTIGKITAQKLIKKFDNLENLLENTHQLSGKIGQTILHYADQGRLSKQLATICRDVPITLDLAQCSYQGANKDKLGALLTLLELHQLKQRLVSNLPFKEDSPLSISTSPPSYTSIDTLSACQALIDKLQHSRRWAFQAKTSNSAPHTAHLLGLAFSYAPGIAYYIPLSTDTRAPFIALLKPLLSTDALKVGHGLKDQLIVLLRHGLEVAPPYFDLMIAHALLEPERSHDCLTLCAQYLQHTPVQITAQMAAQESTEQADLMLQLYPKLSLALEESAALVDQVEMPLIKVLADMELAGVALDLPFLAALSKKTTIAKADLQQKIYTLAGTTFNIDSPKQLGKILFEHLRLSTTPIQTKNGQYATSNRILQKLTHPIVEGVKAYRALQKLYSTYIGVLPSLIHPIDQRLHTSYQQAVVVTGRLSSTSPNLQNIPIRTDEGGAVRKAFVPHAPGDYLFSADYSQIELRILAAYAQDKAMLKAFEEEQDIHQITASKLFKLPLAKIDANMRRQAKIANFGMIYGITAFGLAQQIEQLSPKEAAQYMTAYFEEFPGIKIYMQKTIAYAHEKGYVTTYLGRKHFLPDIHSKNIALRNLAQRNAINTPIQGTAAEMIKLAMIKIHHWLNANKLTTQMIMQVHDELVFNVPEKEIKKIQQHIPLLMEQALPLNNVPIKIHSYLGSNWLEAK